jgi:hypothetical protein
MNKYQKEKSREIRDIMRANPWRKMSYKEAKRQWRKGIRAFRVGEPRMNGWLTGDLAHLGFSRSKMRELGEAYYKILRYCGERNLGFSCRYEYWADSYMLRFNGWSVDGKQYCVRHAVSGTLLRQYRGSLMNIVHRVLDETNCRLQEFIFPSVIKPSDMGLDLDHKMLFSDAEIMSRDAVLAKINVKE